MLLSTMNTSIEVFDFTPQIYVVVAVLLFVHLNLPIKK